MPGAARSGFCIVYTARCVEWYEGNYLPEHEQFDVRKRFLHEDCKYLGKEDWGTMAPADKNAEQHHIDTGHRV